MIEITVDGRNFGKRNGAGCAIQLVFKKHRWVRTFILGKYTANQSELKAVEYALKSISDDFVNHLIRVQTTGKYAVMMLDKNKGDWRRKPRYSVSLVEEIRKQFDRFSSIKIETISGPMASVIAQINEDSIISKSEIFKKEE